MKVSKLQAITRVPPGAKASQVWSAIENAKGETK